MKIDRPLILRLEELARLELSEQERESLTNDLNKILGMVEKMNELDTTGVEPLVYVNPDTNVLRNDIVEGQIDCETALSNAPDIDSFYFKVPKVLQTGQK
jgi:aspartyl-tRNA(Asn)/glutamyl-tRNA(Gln) amidotransferase subunit C